MFTLHRLTPLRALGPLVVLSAVMSFKLVEAAVALVMEALERKREVMVIPLQELRFEVWV